MKLGWLLVLFVHTIMAIKFQLCGYPSNDTICRSVNKCRIIDKEFSQLNSTHIRIHTHLDSCQMTPSSNLELRIDECTQVNICGSNYVTKIIQLDEVNPTNRREKSDLLFGIMGVIFIILWLP